LINGEQRIDETSRSHTEAVEEALASRIDDYWSRHGDGGTDERDEEKCREMHCTFSDSKSKDKMLEVKDETDRFNRGVVRLFV